MKKYLIIILSAIISIHVYAMEMEVETNAITSSDSIDLCILSKYPTDILDLIAQFLPCHDYETEEEFIERTKALIIIYKSKKEWIKSQKKFLIHTHTLNIPPIHSTPYVKYSPDNAIIIASQHIATSEMKSKLYIIDRRANKPKEFSVDRLDSLVAISSDGNLFAKIYPQEEYKYPDERKDHLTIINLCTEKEETYNLLTFLTKYDENSIIAFNKQGTHIIAHGQNNQHQIFELTVNTPNPNADHKKTFAKYCAQRGICKDLIAQINTQK